MSSFSQSVDDIYFMTENYLFAYSLNAVRWELKKNKVSQLDYESVYTLQKSDVYYAFNKDTSDELVQKFQLALDTLKKHGGHQKILNQYY